MKKLIVLVAMKCAINTATHANRKRKDLLLKTFSLSHSDRISVSVKKNEVENVFQVAVVTSVLPITVPISNVLVCKDIVTIINCHHHHCHHDNQGGALVTSLPVLLTVAIALHVLCR